MISSDWVQFGCGLSAPPEWRNFDSSPVLWFQRLPLVGRFAPSGPYGRFPRNVEYGDIVKGLPIRSGHVSLLYSSHVLEHLALDELRLALRDCWRVLRPEGTFRMVLPDLEAIIARYSSDPSAGACNRLMMESILGKQARARGLKGFLRDFLGNRQHLWMWDYKGLAQELADAGFQSVRRAEYGDSTEPPFSLVESPDRWAGCLGVECRK
jgi:SAM-dependent methyltransferase